MKKLTLLACLGICAVATDGGMVSAVAQSAKKPVERYKDIQYPPLNQIKVPTPERFTLDNGLVVYLLEDHQLPLVSASALVRVGSRWEPVEKAGLADVVGSVIRTGGTKTNPGDQLDERLDRMGASVEISIGQGVGSASLSVLKEDTTTGLTILADLLRNPAFPEDKIELEKISARDSIARRNDDPGSIPGREFRRLLYGKDSAYGHQIEYKTINAISKQDCEKYHREFFQPENVMLGVWGDFKTADMKALIQKSFGDWAKGGQPKPPVPSVQDTTAQVAGIHFISKDDVNQSWVRMGYLGGLYKDPDYFALEVMDNILGGGFSSRLFSKVRTDLGLAYSVGSSWAPGWDRPGTFVASGSTKSQSTAQFIQAIQREIVKMTEAEVSDDELQRAKDSILKGFAFEFDSVDKIITRLMTYEYYAYPADFLQKYQANIAKVTKEDVLKVAKDRLKPDRFAIVVLGNAKNFDQPLDKLGKVTEIDITIPKE